MFCDSRLSAAYFMYFCASLCYPSLFKVLPIPCLSPSEALLNIIMNLLECWISFPAFVAFTLSLGRIYRFLHSLVFPSILPRFLDLSFRRGNAVATVANETVKFMKITGRMTVGYCYFFSFLDCCFTGEYHLFPQHIPVEHSRWFT